MRWAGWELDERIEIRTGDELEALADQFNSMAGQLRESYANLEQKVEARTRELTEALEQLKALGEVSQAVSSTLNLETVLTTIVARAVQLSGTTSGVVYEYDEATQGFHPRVTHQMNDELVEAVRAAPIRLREGAVGLDLVAEELQPATRDPRLRERVLRAYEYRCALCGFDVRLGDVLVGVEAAHIQWSQAGGPDTEVNGVALCVMHHKLFDRGAFTVTDSMRIQVSERAHGSAGFQEWLMAFHGKPMRPPQRDSYYPEAQFTSWHLKQVFQGPSRYITGDGT
ncbi:MAG TPA: HNH endonuclease [Syntrophobacteria bacterium]|nr:HNH endonuclease [Syntrophobacteria bacterium]